MLKEDKISLILELSKKVDGFTCSTIGKLNSKSENYIENMLKKWQQLAITMEDLRSNSISSLGI